MPKHTARKARKIVAAILLFFQLATVFSSVAAATTVDNVSVTAASLETNSAAINGMVRVYLSSLGSPSTLNLTIAGNYSVNGDTAQSIASGSAVTVNFSSSTGAITLNRNGSVTNMGMYFALRRHSTSGTNGVKISQARESANPYPGDISFRAVRQSSGSYKLYTVAHIYIENYLYGVLPYEMGNSSSLEALKAQAVAARTYTVRMMQSRSSGYYDVVDTTSDQVYRGTPGGNANCVAAVDATKGVVLKYGSAYTMTYYSASNGGQTESAGNAWGKSGYDYLVVKDDPFDLANTSSTVKSKTVYADLASAANPSGLLALLKTKAIVALNASGYAASAANTALKTLKSVTPHTPKYASPSKLYTKMDFALTASTVTVSGASVTASVTVTCDIFSELESLLSMSIQSTQNELWSVKKNTASFTLQARRYGHGLGMSQRGAMYMGKLGYSYDEILGFYYPGCKRVRQSFTNTILNAASGSEETTVENAAELTGGETGVCKATVRLVSSGSSLAIRSAKSTSAGLVGTAGDGAILTVLSSDGTWCFVQYGSLKGYVPANALRLTGTPSGAEGEATAIQGFATVTANDYVNLRASANTSASILGTAPSGAVLTVFSASGGWARVQYCATTAYASMSFLSAITAGYPSSVASTGSVSATVKTEDGTGTVNLRATASTSGTVLARLPHGTPVTVESDDGAWATISYNGLNGYMMSDYLVMGGETLETGESTDTGTGTDAGTGTGTGTDTGTGMDAGTNGNAGTGAIYATVSAEIAHIRQVQSEASPSQCMLIRGDTVQVTEKGDAWCAVTVSGISGYLPTSALHFSDETTGTGNAGTGDTGGDASGTGGASADGTGTDSAGTGSSEAGGADGAGAGATKAVVTTASGSLNMRSAAKAGSPIVTTIPRGAEVEVTSMGATWCGVSYLSKNGYVMAAFLTFRQGTTLPSVPLAPSWGDTAMVNTLSGSLNLRAQPSGSADVLTRIPQYATVTVTQRGDEWCAVSYNGASGYVMTGYLLLSATASPTPSPTPVESTVPPASDAAADETANPSGSATVPPSVEPPAGTVTATPAATPIPTPAPQQGPKTATVVTPSGSLNLRASPQYGARVLTGIPPYATVSVIQQGDDWCQVTYGVYAGYVMTKFLSLSNGETANAGDPGATGGASAGNAAETAAWVVTASGSLNLRLSPSGSAQVLLALPRYAQVAVLGTEGSWSLIRYNGVTGYAMSVYLSGQNPTGGSATATPTPTPTPTQTDPTAQTPALAQQTETVTATPTPTPTPTPTLAPVAQPVLDPSLRPVTRPAYAIINPRQDQARLSLWPQCAESGPSLTDLDRGAEVQLLQTGDHWCQVQYESLVGYCLTRYLALPEAF